MRKILPRFLTIWLLLAIGAGAPLVALGEETSTSAGEGARSPDKETAAAGGADEFIQDEPATPAPAGRAGELAEDNDPYVVSPQEAARLKSIRQQKGFLPREEDPEAAQPAAEPAPPSEPEFVDRTAPKKLNESIRGFLDSRYGKENCGAPRWCDDLVELRCLKKGDGPIYYYDNTSGNMLMTCGRACINPDPYDKRDCKACPYPAWVECREKAWEEKQAYLRRKELAEIKRIEAEEKARQEKVDAILKQIREIEQECDARIHELEQQLNNIE